MLVYQRVSNLFKCSKNVEKFAECHIVPSDMWIFLILTCGEFITPWRRCSISEEQSSSLRIAQLHITNPHKNHIHSVKVGSQIWSLLDTKLV
jgi:hypothetical protein